jgi:hypothetical protein
MRDKRCSGLVGIVDAVRHHPVALFIMHNDPRRL